MKKLEIIFDGLFHFRYTSKMARPHEVPLVVLGLIITIVGITLNLLIFILYIAKKSIPRNFSNRLLLHHAFVDLVNLVILVLPFTCRSLYLFSIEDRLKHSGEFDDKWNAIFLYFYEMLPLSTNSTVFTFTLEAIDRLIANHCKKMHEKFQRKRIMIPIITLIWLLSIIPTVIMFFEFWMASWVFKYAIDCMTIINTILIVLAFYKSRKKLIQHRLIINDHPENQNVIEMVKRDFRLTLIFFLMFIIFLLPAIGLSVGAKRMQQRGDKYFILMIYSIGVASTLNPVLTLTLKGHFKGTQVRSMH